LEYRSHHYTLVLSGSLEVVDLPNPFSAGSVLRFARLLEIISCCCVFVELMCTGTQPLFFDFSIPSLSGGGDHCMYKGMLHLAAK
jgi:hypothetical protein